MTYLSNCDSSRITFGYFSSFNRYFSAKALLVSLIIIFHLPEVIALSFSLFGSITHCVKSLVWFLGFNHLCPSVSSILGTICLIIFQMCLIIYISVHFVSDQVTFEFESQLK